MFKKLISRLNNYNNEVNTIKKKYDNRKFIFRG